QITASERSPSRARSIKSRKHTAIVNHTSLNPSKRLLWRLPLDRINWITSSFLIGTLVMALTGVPLYLYYFGLDWFQIALFFAMFLACGFSISIGYHRLFSHITFKASWPIRLLTLVFGAAA